MAVSKQRGQSSESFCRLFNSQQTTKEAVAELCWLAAEHYQLLAGLLSLCRDCTNKVRMGNHDGKFPDCEEDPEVHLGVQAPCDENCSISERKGAVKSKKVKRLEGKKQESFEDIRRPKAKRKFSKGKSHVEPTTDNKLATSQALQAEQIPEEKSSNHVPGSTLCSSNYREANKPIVTTEEPFQITQENWDFVESNQTIDSVMDFCNDFSECDGELGYASSSCSLIEGLNRQQSGGNLRPIKRFDSNMVETLAGSGSAVNKTGLQVYSDTNQRNPAIRVVAKLQDVEGKVFNVSHACSNGTLQHSGTITSKHERGECGMQNGGYRLGESKKTGTKLPEGLWLPLSNPAEPSAPVISHSKSPSSPSLAGVFNKSFPASNSLQSMSLVLSPLSSKQMSPQLNHRIVLLSDKDEDPCRDSSNNKAVHKSYSEVIDGNGNKQTVTHLDLDLNRRPSSSKRNSSSNSTTTGEL